MSEPFVSVILPVYNQQAKIGRAVRSILSQTWQDFELIVIDDGSTDGTWKNLLPYGQEPRTRLVKETHRGLTPTLNHGLKLARGELIARQDSDDLSDPTRLERQVAFMDSHPDIGVLGTWARLYKERPDMTEDWDPVISDPEIRSHLFYGENPIVHGSALFRRRCYEECGGYGQEFVYAQDYELWTRFAQRFQFANLPEHLYYHFCGKERVSATFSDEQRQMTKRIKKNHQREMFDLFSKGALNGSSERKFPADAAELLRRLIRDGFRRKEWETVRRLASCAAGADPWGVRARWQFLNASFQGWARPMVKKVLRRTRSFRKPVSDNLARTLD